MAKLREEFSKYTKDNVISQVEEVDHMGMYNINSQAHQLGMYCIVLWKLYAVNFRF